MKKQMQNEEIAKIIERQNVITFKKKGEPKISIKSQKDDEDEIESAHSLKSGAHSDQNSISKLGRRNFPLPQLNKEKKRMMIKNLLPEGKLVSTNNYLQKQVRQHDNLLLKQNNNHLTSENMKLKTKNMNLEKEIMRLQKMIEDDPSKIRPSPISSKQIKFRNPQTMTVKIAMRNLQKQLDELKKQNSKIKLSVKFTTINELQIQRDAILQQTVRLRQIIDEQRNKLLNTKISQHGISSLQQRVLQLQQRNTHLTKENNELKSKLMKTDDMSRSSLKNADNEKNLNKMLFNARRLLKEKQKQIDNLKAKLQKTDSVKIVESAKVINSNGTDKQLKTKLVASDQTKGTSKEKRVMSKSAQKYRTSEQRAGGDNCLNCKKLKDQVASLTKQLQQANSVLKIERERVGSQHIGQLPKGPIDFPTAQELDKVSRFLTFRFKAHHLSAEQSCYHLLNCEGKPEELEVQITIGDLIQILIAEPFSILSNRYIQACILAIGYASDIKNPKNKEAKILIDQTKKIKRKQILANFKHLVAPYQLINQSKEEEMFIQIAQLITNYHQHILTALNDKKNGQGTIHQDEFNKFFKQIQLQKEYTDFMISQIILESLDLEHLNYYNLFEIFYMPPQEFAQEEPQGKKGGNKKKYNMIESVVKEEDEEYEESKSFLQSRQKTLSRKEQPDEQDQYEQDYEKNQSDLKNQSNVQQYQENFQEEKMQNHHQEEKTNEDHKKQEEPQHYIIEEAHQDYVEDYQS